MKTLYLILYVIAVGCFAAAGLFGAPLDAFRIRLLGIGLLALTLVPLIELTQTTT